MKSWKPFLTGSQALTSPDQDYEPPGDAVSPPAIKATPYRWRDPKHIPPRQWLYGRHYVRSYVTATVAPGGLGKSSLCLVEAIAMATGRNLLGVQPSRPLGVWYWNGEDPLEETERRIAAILLHYRIPPEELAARLFIDSGRDMPIVLAEKVGDRLVVAHPVVDALKREMLAKQIDVLIIDPFVSSHVVPENDNGAIDRVAKTWARLADETGAAVELVHHVRKPGNGQLEITIDDARGAVALIGAVRSARVLNGMSEKEADLTGVSAEERKLHFRVGTGKSNMAPPAQAATWRKLISVPLDNGTEDDPGDWVGVVTAWVPPSVFEGVSVDDVRRVQAKIAEREWAQSSKSATWAGFAVAEVLGLDAYQEPGKQRCSALLQAWINGGALKVKSVRDKAKARDRPVVVVGGPV